MIHLKCQALFSLKRKKNVAIYNFECCFFYREIVCIPAFVAAIFLLIVLSTVFFFFLIKKKKQQKKRASKTNTYQCLEGGQLGHPVL